MGQLSAWHLCSPPTWLYVIGCGAGIWQRPQNTIFVLIPNLWSWTTRLKRQFPEVKPWNYIFCSLRGQRNGKMEHMSVVIHCLKGGVIQYYSLRLYDTLINKLLLQSYNIQLRHADNGMEINMLQHVYDLIRVKIDNSCTHAPRPPRWRITWNKKVQDSQH